MTILLTAIFFLLVVSVGWLLIGRLWSDKLATAASGVWVDAISLVEFVIAGGLGIGLASCLWFVCMLFSSSSAWAPFAVELILFVVFGSIALIGRSRRGKEGRIAGPSEGSDSTADPRWLKGVTIMVAASSLACFALLTIAHPYGDWDAVFIWNLRARFLFAGGEHWRDAFSSYLFWSHPDYPLLLPGFVACCWRLLGWSAAVIPALVALFFFAATASLLFLIVYIVRGKTQALWALALLLSTPNMVEQGANQCADIPLGFFFLAALSCIFLADRIPAARVRLLVTAGLMAGFAAWTKNEGILFVCVLALVHILVNFRADPSRASWRDRIAPLIGALPVVALVLCLKQLTPPNDIVGDQSLRSALACLSDWNRYVVIATHFILQSVLFGRWTISPVPVVLVWWLCTPGRINPWNNKATRTVALTLALMVVGYFLTYLMLPTDLPAVSTRLTFSLDRLFVALWPAALALTFCTIGSVESRRT